MVDEIELPYDLNRALKDTLAIVLAGGRGARLNALTENQSKPAIPFGGKFRIIDFSLSNCLHSNIRRIAVLTQYKAHTLLQHLQRGWTFMRSELNELVEVWPAQQQTSEKSWYRGTADAVFQNLRIIREYSPEYVFILGGDHVYKQDYSIMLAEHIERKADCTIACVEVPKDDAVHFGVVTVDDNGRALDFVEKSPDPPTIPGQSHLSLASMGIYIFNAAFLLEHLDRDARTTGSSHDFGKDVIPHLVERHRVMAHRFSDSCVTNKGTNEVYWRDVGTVDAYWEANLDLTSLTPALDLYDPDWPIWTYQLQRPAAKFVFDDELRRGMAVDSLVSAGCIVSGAEVRRSLLFTDVRVSSFSSVEDSIILPGSVIDRHCHIRRAIVDSNCRIPEGLVIGEDPALDSERFFRTERGITLVTVSMLEAMNR